MIGARRIINNFARLQSFGRNYSQFISKKVTLGSSAITRNNCSTFDSKVRRLQWLRYNARCMSSTSGKGKKGKGTKDDQPEAYNDNQEELSTNVPANVVVPDYYPNVPCITVGRSPIYPLFVKVIEVTNKKLIEVLNGRFKIGQPYAGVFLRKDKQSEPDSISSLDEIHNIGTFVKVGDYVNLPDKLRIFVQGHRRIRVINKISVTPTPVEDQQQTEASQKDQKDADGHESNEPEQILIVNTENWNHLPYEEDAEQKKTVKAISQEIMDSVRKLIKLNPVYYESLQHLIEANRKMIEEPVHLADFGASLTTAEAENLQEILSERDIRSRLLLALELLKKECAVAELQQQIGKEIEEKNVNMQRKYLLQEQLKIIKRELGIEKDDKEAILEKYKEKLKGKTVPAEAQKAIDEELNRLSFLESHSQEFGVIRNYLDWLTNMPWGQFSKDNLDIARARTVLNDDHYGLDDIKDRILEFIAVGQLKEAVHGKILCFVGPPGVGKTSVGKSIARALNREFFRFSVGGMTDVAEIKGHRRTYVGAMPGKAIQCLKKTQTSNPVILIDEIDKISTSYRGDPSSALLELLDPEQNSNFLDHYLDVPVDLSNVLFICTANLLETIPGPLQDRMEVINVSGYIADEKVAIAQHHLMPLARSICGVQDKGVTLSESAIWTLVESYCRESGVRNLQKHIEKVFRKAALKIVQGENEVVIDKDNLEDFVGQPVFKSDKIYEVTPPGIVMGLAWTSLGGSTLYIETISNTIEEDGKNNPGLELTGHLGDVMKESSRIAYTCAKHFIAEIQPENKYFSKAAIHLHVPEGATPKDGPSAGCTITTALISLALNKSVRQNFAMTGEISLTGKILPVGGIKEKLIAARRAGVEHIVLPAGNKKEHKELHKSITDGLSIQFAETYRDVYDVAFAGSPN